MCRYKYCGRCAYVRGFHLFSRHDIEFYFIFTYDDITPTASVFSISILMENNFLFAIVICKSYIQSTSNWWTASFIALYRVDPYVQVVFNTGLYVLVIGIICRMFLNLETLKYVCLAHTHTRSRFAYMLIWIQI